MTTIGCAHAMGPSFPIGHSNHVGLLKTLQETVEAVEAPWGRRYERELRDVLLYPRPNRSRWSLFEDRGLAPSPQC